MKSQAFIFYVLENISEVEKELEREITFELEWKKKLSKIEEEENRIEDETDEDNPLSFDQVMEIL